MKKLKANKKATRGKAKAWKKGQSSSYNPAFNKFRQEAKKQAIFGGCQAGNSFLTESAVALHNKDVDVPSRMDDDENIDGSSISGLSFVSTFSQCSNPSFNRLLKSWQSDSSLHKEMLAVLAAVTEVIKSKGGKETETEYFAALMTTLDIVENDEAVTAVITLLYMVLKRLPVNVLKSEFLKTCTKLSELLDKYSSSDYNALLRNLIGCLHCFLRVQNFMNWKGTPTEIFKQVLQFTVHQKPKVRKAAQDAVRFLLKKYNADSINDSNMHPAIEISAEFYCSIIKSNPAFKGRPQTVLHVLNLLEDIIGYFPQEKLKTCCEVMLGNMVKTDAVIRVTCLKVFQGLFLKNPKPKNLPVKLNIQIIKGLYDYQPNVNDSEPVIQWLLALESAFLNLYRLSPSTCLNHLPNLFKVVVGCWLSEKPDIYPLPTSVLKNILQTCVQPSSAEFQQFMLDDPVKNPMHKMFEYVEKGLGYQYNKAWKHVLVVLATFFDVMGKHSYPVMIKCLQSLADLRNTTNFPYIAQLDETFIAAIRRMGPEIVLKAVPHQITEQKILDGESDFPRSWLLPVMRESIRETKLDFFREHFLHLAKALKQKFEQCEREKKILQAKTYEVLCLQIWSLLPGFCTLPTDLKESFGKIAKILGEVLKQNPELRVTVLSSLRVLITKNMENDENKQVIAYYAKNYFPILFRLYCTETKNAREEGVRLAVFETIKTYLQIADKELCEKFFVLMMEKLKDCEVFEKHALLDLCKAMVPYVSEDRIKELYMFCKPLLLDLNHTIQKKSYGVLNELCYSKTESCVAFVKSNIEDLKSLLLTSLSSSAPSSKALRLNCLCQIVNQLTEENQDFITAVVPEATLCTKETAVKARSAAYKLLIEVGRTLQKWQPDNKRGALRKYMQMLLAGFTESPHLISATILAIGCVIYEFKDDMDSDIIHLLIENICLLLTSNSREVVTSALSFIKILFSTISTEDLAQHVEYLVSSIAGISEDNQRHFRFKAKELFTRLIRKFGYEMISKLVPEKFRKQVANIRKLETRKTKRKNMQHEESDDESITTKTKSDSIDDILEDTDDELGMESSTSKQKQKLKRRKADSGAWIEEMAENDIVDFMDPTASKKILASHPDKNIKPKSSRGFKVSEDGRLIISDENESKTKGKKRKIDEDTESMATELNSKSKKRKQNDSSDDDEELPASYKPVLKGIHRILNKEKKTPGSKFKAKKAAGDVKKGKVNPYAHIQVNRKLLNKRKQKKLQSQFKGLVHAAKKGAKKGLKARAKKGRKRT